MNTEITEHIKGWVLYDGDCAFCRQWVERTRLLLLRRGFHFVPLQAVWVRERLGHAENESLTEMKLLAPDGRILGGADAIVEMTRSIWWAWPFYALAQLPGIKPILRAVYSRIARNRHCFAGRCQLPTQRPHNHRHLTSSFYELP